MNKDQSNIILAQLKDDLKEKINTLSKGCKNGFEMGLCAAYERTLAEIEFMEKKYIGEQL